jgi:hypothetical protein
MSDPCAIDFVSDFARAIYARLAEGEMLSGEEVTMLDPAVLEALRERARRNQRHLHEEGETLRLTAPR